MLLANFQREWRTHDKQTDLNSQLSITRAMVNVSEYRCQCIQAGIHSPRHLNLHPHVHPLPPSPCVPLRPGPLGFWLPGTASCSPVTACFLVFISIIHPTPCPLLKKSVCKIFFIFNIIKNGLLEENPFPASILTFFLSIRTSQVLEAAFWLLNVSLRLFVEGAQVELVWKRSRKYHQRKDVYLPAPRPTPHHFFLVAVLNIVVMAGAGAPCWAVRRKGAVIIMILGSLPSCIVPLIVHEKIIHFQFESVILLSFEMKSNPNYQTFVNLSLPHQSVRPG